MRNFSSILLCLVTTVAASASRAATIFDGAIGLWPVGTEFTDTYDLSVFQDAAQTDYTGVRIKMSHQSYALDAQLEGIFRLLDEGSDWYLASYGEAFAKDQAMPGDPSLLIGSIPVLSGIIVKDVFTAPNYFSGPPSDFYLAVATNKGPIGARRDVFGWVKLRWSHLPGGSKVYGLSLVDSAMAYGSGGIKVGTRTLVPEPSGLGLALLAGIALRFGRRHN